jgi:hypothetical protein
MDHFDDNSEKIVDLTRKRRTPASALKKMLFEKMSDPPIVDEIREDVKQNFECAFCKGTRRANVYYEHEKSEKAEDSHVIEIECRAFYEGDMCGHTDIRYYPK